MEDIPDKSEGKFVGSGINRDLTGKNEKQGQDGNPRLADALAKVIRMSKSKDGKSVVLSKAKLYSPKTGTKKSHCFEIEPDPNEEIKIKEEVIKADFEDVKPIKKDFNKFRLTKQEKLQRGRLKPSPLDRGKEKPLQKIATKGVVQLFNAVRQQQATISQHISKPGITEGKKEKILKSIDKKAFLDVLMGRKKNTENDSNHSGLNAVEEEVKSEPEDEPTWKVLRDDFMMGAKLKDWDKREMEVMEA